MDPLGDPLTTRPIQTGWEFTMEPYPSGQFVFIDDPDRQLGNGSVWTRTRTQSDGPELLLTLPASAISKIARSQPAGASPNWLDHGLQVHLHTRSIAASKCYLQSDSITASNCIFKLARSRPPSASPNPLYHGLQVYLQTRSITASKFT